MSDKPRILTVDMGGLHNADLHATSTRLLEGATWKKQRVVVLVPAGKSIPSPVYLAHVNLAFPPNQGAFRMLCQGMEVGEAYSNGIEFVINHPELSQWEFLLTMEHDNTPAFDGLLRLIQRMDQHPEFACIGGLYFTKGEGGVAQIWGDIRDPVMNFRPQVPDPNGGLIECWGVGCGFNLWRLSMFKDSKLRRPWFKTLTGIEGQGIGTQDLYFWSDARKNGYRCAVACDVKVGHYCSVTDTWW